MKKISKIYGDFINYCENINPDEKRKIENAMIRLASLAVVITAIVLFKMLD
jgi:hypothetical protein